MKIDEDEIERANEKTAVTNRYFIIIGCVILICKYRSIALLAFLSLYSR